MMQLANYAAVCKSPAEAADFLIAMNLGLKGLASESDRRAVVGKITVADKSFSSARFQMTLEGASSDWEPDDPALSRFVKSVHDLSKTYPDFNVKGFTFGFSEMPGANYVEPERKAHLESTVGGQLVAAPTLGNKLLEPRTEVAITTAAEPAPSRGMKMR
jgi:hypothetical protein